MIERRIVHSSLVWEAEVEDLARPLLPLGRASSVALWGIHLTLVITQDRIDWPIMIMSRPKHSQCLGLGIISFSFNHYIVVVV